jgi:prefoldin subunit 5
VLGRCPAAILVSASLGLSSAEPVLAQERSEGALIGDVSRGIDELHERVWRIQDEAARKRTGGIAAGLLLGAGFDMGRQKTNPKAHAAPIVAGRLYFFDTDVLLANRAVERLDHVEAFSLPDISRMIAEASRRLDERRRQLQAALVTMKEETDQLTKDEERLVKAIEGAHCREQGNADKAPTPAGAAMPTVPAEDQSLAQKVACTEDLQRYDALEGRLLYVFEKQVEAKGAIEDLDKSLGQVKLAEKECAELRQTVRALRESAREAQVGKFLGGSFVEAFVGLGLDIVGSEASEDVSSSDVLAGLGYGFGVFSAGIYAAPHFGGLYLGLAVPLFER